MGSLHVLLLSAIAFQMVIGEDALDQSAVDRQVRYPQYCDETLYYNRGLIYSNSYPSNYYNNMDCKTRIIPQLSGRYNMRFYFCDFMSETGIFGCNDYLQLGTSGETCGAKTSKSYMYTTSGAFNILFHSDRSITKRGYKIAFCADCNSVAEVKALCSQRSTTQRPHRTTTGSRFTYPRHKRGFFFNKKTSTPRISTSRFTYPFTFGYPHH